MNIWRFFNDFLPSLRHRPSKASPLCSDIRFQELEAAGAVVCEFAGVLESGGSYRYRLRVEHLRQLRRGLEPFRVTPNSTHQFWLWGQKRHGDFKPVLLYRAQADLGHYLIKQRSDACKGDTFQKFKARRAAEAEIDKCAVFISRYLASLLGKAHNPGEMLAGDYDFYSLAIDRAYRGCEFFCGEDGSRIQV